LPSVRDGARLPSSCRTAATVMSAILSVVAVTAVVNMVVLAIAMMVC
jgi:hypothetical protein